MKDFRKAWKQYNDLLDSYNCENPMKTNYLFTIYNFIVFTAVYFKAKHKRQPMIITDNGVYVAANFTQSDGVQ